MGGHTVSESLPALTLRDAARSRSPAQLCTAGCATSSPSLQVISTYLIIPLPSLGGPERPWVLKRIAVGAVIPKHHYLSAMPESSKPVCQ